ncbi:hypothetical protein [Streptomyces sp. NPDC005281]|uniref:hypothetical protein n=1 Tax=Streptomyces sp. NPDC005281 TaxID=3155712 RepID=UPI0033B51B9F
METPQAERPLRTIVDRFGWPKVLIGSLLIGCLIGFVKVELSGNDSPPSCAKQYANVYGGGGGEYMNKMVECDQSVEKWCAKHHPEAADDCSNAIEIDGDDRNVGKG